MVDRGLAEMVEHGAHVAARVARVAHRLAIEHLEKLGEPEHAPPAAEPRLDLLGDREHLGGRRARITHDQAPMPFRLASASDDVRGYFVATTARTLGCSSKQFSAEHTLTLNVPAIASGP